MLRYLLCDRCHVPSTVILHLGHPGKEQALCDRCYDLLMRPRASPTAQPAEPSGDRAQHERPAAQPAYY